mmetsp:Transcript_29445/g.83035  ORF Transcript_29445/g.83035 Transcript_29445/m.83035 type:complete len:261 (-) Transcript_29445:897-1679(-)
MEAIDVHLCTEVHGHDNAGPASCGGPCLVPFSLQVDVEKRGDLIGRLRGVARELGREKVPFLGRAVCLTSELEVLQVVGASQMAENNLVLCLPEVLPAMVDNADRCLGTHKPFEPFGWGAVEAHDKVVRVDLCALLFQQHHTTISHDSACAVKLLTHGVPVRQPLPCFLPADLSYPLPCWLLSREVHLDERPALHQRVVLRQHRWPGEGLRQLPLHQLVHVVLLLEGRGFTCLAVAGPGGRRRSSAHRPRGQHGAQARAT